MPRPARLLRLLLLLALVACGGKTSEPAPPEETPPDEEPELTGVRVRFVPTREPGAPGSWLGFPFPADHRRTAAGTVELSDFPNPSEATLVERYRATVEADVDGFSTSGAIYLAFDGALDPAALPDSAGTLGPTGAVQLIDVDPDSPERGRRRPLRLAYQDAATSFLPAHALAVAPEWGFPMRPGTTYALVLTDELRGADRNPLRRPSLLRWLLAGEEAAALTGFDPELLSELRASYAPLRALFAEEGLDPSRVVAATVFTTQDSVGQLGAIRRQVVEEQAAPTPGPWQVPAGAQAPAKALRTTFRWRRDATVTFWVLEGTVRVPNYQEGEVPYALEGGRLHEMFGGPLPVRDEDLRFVLTIPEAPPSGGPCHPIVQYAHGTGGDAYSFLLDGTAGRLAGRRLAAISIDQPLSGPRAEGRQFDVGQMSFNFANPDAARAVFRQSAVDTFVLTRLVRETLVVPADVAPGGREICFDPERVGFFGHSQGGLTGAMAAAFEDRVSAWVLSGAGGGFGITVMERKDVADIAEFASLALGLPPDEPLHELHPALMLLQLLVDVTDPVSYAPLWRERRNHVLLTSGEHDEATPFRTATALAVAGGLPPVLPVNMPSNSFELAGLEPLASPVRANRDGRTMGLLQYTDDLAGEDMDTHFLVFNRPEAIHASMKFLETAAIGTAPLLERDPAAEAW